MKNAFLVSDEDLKSLRTEPWFIELNGPAVFMHESVLRLLEKSNRPPTDAISDNGVYFCDQPTCDKSKPNPHVKFFGFKRYNNLRSHMFSAHGIPGSWGRKGPNARAKLAPPPTRRALPAPISDTEKTAKAYGAKSYDYKEFDAQGICGIGDCTFKDTVVRTLHFHRSVKHGVRGVNWKRNYHQAKKRMGKPKLGRPRKVA